MASTGCKVAQYDTRRLLLYHCKLWCSQAVFSESNQVTWFATWHAGLLGKQQGMDSRSMFAQQTAKLHGRE